MSLIIPDVDTAIKTEPIPDGIIRVMHSENVHRAVMVDSKAVKVAATNHIVVSPAMLGAIRHHVNKKVAYEILPTEVLHARDLPSCLELVVANGNQELFLRAKASNIDRGEFVNIRYKTDLAHMFRLSLPSLMTIKAAWALDVFDKDGTDEAVIAAYLDKVPTKEAVAAVDMTKRKSIEEFEDDVEWRVYPVTLDAAGNNPVYLPNFGETSMNLKNSWGEKPPTLKEREKRDRDETLAKELEAQRFNKILRGITDFPGGRVFTLSGRYDLSKIATVNDDNGETQSIILPFLGSGA